MCHHQLKCLVWQNNSAARQKKFRSISVLRLPLNQGTFPFKWKMIKTLSFKLALTSPYHLTSMTRENQNPNMTILYWLKRIPLMTTPQQTQIMLRLLLSRIHPIQSFQQFSLVQHQTLWHLQLLPSRRRDKRGSTQRNSTTLHVKSRLKCLIYLHRITGKEDRNLITLSSPLSLNCKLFNKHWSQKTLHLGGMQCNENMTLWSQTTPGHLCLHLQITKSSKCIGSFRWSSMQMALSTVIKQGLLPRAILRIMVLITMKPLLQLLTSTPFKLFLLLPPTMILNSTRWMLTLPFWTGSLLKISTSLNQKVSLTLNILIMFANYKSVCTDSNKLPASGITPSISIFGQMDSAVPILIHASTSKLRAVDNASSFFMLTTCLSLPHFHLWWKQKVSSHPDSKWRILEKSNLSLELKFNVTEQQALSFSDKVVTFKISSTPLAWLNAIQSPLP